MAIRFYFDEHIKLAIAGALRKRGVDILTAQEAGMLGVADEVHFQMAVSQDMAIFTQDTDFLRLHKSGVTHHGIVYTHRSTPIGKIIQGLLLIYQVLTDEEMKNHVEYF